MDDSEKKGLETGNNFPEENPVSLKLQLPPFWSASPTTWFLQAEAQFTVSRVKREGDKYNLVVASLPQEIAESISDFLIRPPTHDQYTELKKVLIDRHSLSLERRVRLLITGQEIGDKKPSDFYRSLKSIAGTSGTVGDALIRKIWQSRLPNLINLALIPHSEEDLDKVLSLADSLYEAMQPDVASVGSTGGKGLANTDRVSNPSRTSAHVDYTPDTSSSYYDSNTSGDRFEGLQRQISELKGMMSEMFRRQPRSSFRVSSSRSHSRSRSRSRNRRDTRRSVGGNGRLCWYHFKFGNRATKCTEPCAWNQSSDPVSSFPKKN